MPKDNDNPTKKYNARRRLKNERKEIDTQYLSEAGIPERMFWGRERNLAPQECLRG